MLAQVEVCKAGIDIIGCVLLRHGHGVAGTTGTIGATAVKLHVFGTDFIQRSPGKDLEDRPHGVPTLQYRAWAQLDGGIVDVVVEVVGGDSEVDVFRLPIHPEDVAFVDRCNCFLLSGGVVLKC